MARTLAELARAWVARTCNVATVGQPKLTAVVAVVVVVVRAAPRAAPRAHSGNGDWDGCYKVDIQKGNRVQTAGATRATAGTITARKVK